jgi:hypothetical protein
MGFRHLLWYVGTAYVSAYVSGHMGMAEPNKKASIGGSKTEMSEWSGADQNNRIKIEKGAILLQSGDNCGQVRWSGGSNHNNWEARACHCSHLAVRPDCPLHCILIQAIFPLFL